MVVTKNIFLHFYSNHKTNLTKKYYIWKKQLANRRLRVTNMWETSFSQATTWHLDVQLAWLNQGSFFTNKVKMHCNALGVQLGQFQWKLKTPLSKSIQKKWNGVCKCVFMDDFWIKARLHIPFTHAFTALHCIFWLVTLVCWFLWKNSYYFKNATQCRKCMWKPDVATRL